MFCMPGRWLVVVSHRLTFRDEIAEWCHVTGNWRTPGGQRLKHVPVAGYEMNPRRSSTYPQYNLVDLANELTPGREFVKAAYV